MNTGKVRSQRKSNPTVIVPPAPALHRDVVGRIALQVPRVVELVNMSRVCKTWHGATETALNEIKEKSWDRARPSHAVPEPRLTKLALEYCFRSLGHAAGKGMVPGEAERALLKNANHCLEQDEKHPSMLYWFYLKPSGLLEEVAGHLRATGEPEAELAKVQRDMCRFVLANNSRWSYQVIQSAAQLLPLADFLRFVEGTVFEPAMYLEACKSVLDQLVEKLETAQAEEWQEQGDFAIQLVREILLRLAGYRRQYPEFGQLDASTRCQYVVDIAKHIGALVNAIPKTKSLKRHRLLQRVYSCLHHFHSYPMQWPARLSQTAEAWRAVHERMIAEKWLPKALRYQYPSKLGR